MRTKLFVLTSLVIMAAMLLGACAPQTVVVTKEVPGATQVVTQMVQGTPQVVVVTATPEPTKAVSAGDFKSADPTTFSYVTGAGEPVTFDPALAYDTASGGIIHNVYETLVWYNKEQPAQFIPQLATELPSAENGGISADGKTYTFKIRQGVTFHNGDPLTPGDVAYSFIRGLLQSGGDSPQWLLTEPFFGIGMQDISAVVQALKDGAKVGDTLTADQINAAAGTALNGDPTAMQAEDPAILKSTCEWVSSLIKADDAAGTVTMQLAQPWGPFLATIANTWGSIMDKKWVAENKGWDGSCDTWQNFYGITSENDPFNAIENGTGPYKLTQWVQGQEIDLEAYDGYWRTEPAWEGGPTGPAAIKNVVIKNVNEWGTRFAMLQAGDADFVYTPPDTYSQLTPMVGETCPYDANTGQIGACQPTDTPDQPLRLVPDRPVLSQTTLMFNFAVNVEGGNPYIGSGKLDGNGIPPEFFSDVHVRKAFEYCFNWDMFIKSALAGFGVQSKTLALPGMPGYDANQAAYSYDPAKCEEEFKASTLKSADGKSLWDTGFRFQLTYNTGNTTRETVAQILSSDIAKVNRKFVVEVLGTPWATILSAYQHGRLPAFIIGWQEDIHDPHNWYQPYGPTGTYGSNQNFPADLKKQLTDLVNAGVAEADSAKRAEIYKQYNQIVYDQATMLLLAVQTTNHYEQRWVNGYYYNPIYPDVYFYTLSKQ
jgi:peptide/nickel transport system substrate-binding protein